MGKLIGTEDAYKILTEYYHHRTEMQHKALRTALDRVPGEEIIHCKDCKHYEKDVDRIPRFCMVLAIPVTGDDYCSRGERKDE